jgi:anti-sigma B factor antagonist
MSSPTQIAPLVPAPAPGLDVVIRRVGRRTVIEASGEIDIATAGVLSDAIHVAVEEGASELWIDLVGVAFMDSTGLHVLTVARRRLAPLNRRMSVICPPGPARRVIDIAGLDAAIDVVPSRTAAHHAS